jgi:hypothetical protein
MIYFRTPSKPREEDKMVDGVSPGQPNVPHQSLMLTRTGMFLPHLLLFNSAVYGSINYIIGIEFLL